MSTAPDRFVLDANAFIQAKRRFYGLDFCPGYWGTLIWHYQQGRICSIDKIRDEIMRGGDDQAKQVTGRGDAGGKDEDATTCEDNKEGGNDIENGKRMTAYKFTSMLVSLHLYDFPVGYTPPVGPALDFKIMYNQRDANQPAVFDYSNFGPKWTMNLVGYVQDDPMNPSADVKIYRIGGGYRYTDFNPTTQTFAVQPKSLDVLKRLSSSPIKYERLKTDGSREIYEESNGSTVPGRKVFLTKIIDPHGNELRLHYDSIKRITAITDAVGQVSTLTYGLADKPYLITRITDPFCRSARFD